MLSVSEALARVAETVSPLDVLPSPLLESLGLVLAEGVHADLDSPPFDKALMDGYAVREADLCQSGLSLRVTGEVIAGRVGTVAVGSGDAVRIMTGAPLPEGAEAVVPVELTRSSAGAEQGRFTPTGGGSGAALPDAIQIEPHTPPPGRNILRRGQSTREGSLVLSSGVTLSPRHLGILAELGRATVSVFRRPRVGILATGDELVEIAERPGPAQIRNSNETMLAAQVLRMGAIPVPLGIARDNREHLSARIQAGLECDVLLLSGGVSAGLLDLVPSCLQHAGVREVFHKVRLKPGQPLWFGMRDGSGDAARNGTGKTCYVFGLPGNPVSSLVCTELFVFAAISRLLGRPTHARVPVPARLMVPFQHRGMRPTYHPARIETLSASGTQTPVVTPVAWSGSADLCATAEANSLAIFEAGDRDYPAGSEVSVLSLDAP